MLQQQCDGSLLSSDFKHNSAANGGAAFLNDFTMLLAMSSNFTSNSATASSGGLQVQSVANATVQGCIFNRCAPLRCACCLHLLPTSARLLTSLSGMARNQVTVASRIAAWHAAAAAAALLSNHTLLMAWCACSNTGSKGAGLYLGTVNGSYTDNYFLVSPLMLQQAG